MLPPPSEQRRGFGGPQQGEGAVGDLVRLGQSGQRENSPAGVRACLGAGNRRDTSQGWPDLGKPGLLSLQERADHPVGHTDRGAVPSYQAPRGQHGDQESPSCAPESRFRGPQTQSPSSQRIAPLCVSRHCGRLFLSLVLFTLEHVPCWAALFCVARSDVGLGFVGLPGAAWRAPPPSTAPRLPAQSSPQGKPSSF